MKAVLQPDYYKNFTCIGSACEDTCCAGWSISIDSKSKEKYKKNPSSKINLKAGIDGDSFKRVNNACHFLTEDKLCQIQLTLGEEYLTETCASYPREFKQVGNVIEIAATVSCPEAARLVLLNPLGIGFETEERQTPSAAKVIDSNDHFYDVRTLVIGVLQDRKYELSDRLIILALYFTGIDQYRGYENDFLVEDFSAVLADIKSDSEIQFKMIHGLYELLKDESKENERYKECYNSSAEFLIHSHKYQEARNLYYEPFMLEHDFIMENYLVNYAFRIGDFTGSIEQFHLMVVYYAMLKYLLIGLAGANQGLSEEMIVKAVQSFSKRYEHHPATQAITKYLKDKGFAELHDLISIIK